MFHFLFTMRAIDIGYLIVALLALTMSACKIRNVIHHRDAWTGMRIMAALIGFAIAGNWLLVVFDVGLPMLLRAWITLWMVGLLIIWVIAHARVEW